MSWRVALVAGAVALATGCGPSNAKVFLKDAPLDGATAVNVTLTGLTVISNGKSEVVFDAPKSFNLLELQNGTRAFLGDVEYTGQIEQLRLEMDGTAAVAYADETVRTARVPSGAQTGIKLIGPFDPSGSGEITLDFVASESIHEDGKGELVMRPTIVVLTDGQRGVSNPDGGAQTADAGQ